MQKQLNASHNSAEEVPTWQKDFDYFNWSNMADSSVIRTEGKEGSFSWLRTCLRLKLLLEAATTLHML